MEEDCLDPLEPDLDLWLSLLKLMFNGILLGPGGEGLRTKIRGGGGLGGGGGPVFPLAVVGSFAITAVFPAGCCCL